MLDLFAGRLGWTKAFLARGWECVAVDLVEPPEIPQGVRFIKLDVLQMMHFAYPIPHFSVKEGPNPFWESCAFDFICASSPCEEFSVHGMKLFHPNPKYPENGIRLFEHTRRNL
jgi:site-specific DNA-cytosine methylase